MGKNRYYLFWESNHGFRWWEAGNKDNYDHRLFTCVCNRFFFKKIPPSISVFLGNCFFPCNPSVFTLQKRKEGKLQPGAEGNVGAVPVTQEEETGNPCCEGRGSCKRDRKVAWNSQLSFSWGSRE